AVGRVLVPLDELAIRGVVPAARALDKLEVFQHVHRYIRPSGRVFQELPIRPCRRIAANVGSAGRAWRTCPSRPCVVSAQNNASITASSTASTVAWNNLVIAAPSSASTRRVTTVDAGRWATGSA